MTTSKRPPWWERWTWGEKKGFVVDKRINRPSPQRIIAPTPPRQT